MVKYVYVVGRCPICGSNKIERDDVEFESNCIWYPCTCTDCGKVFNEVYPFADSYVEWEDCDE